MASEIIEYRGYELYIEEYGPGFRAPNSVDAKQYVITQLGRQALVEVMAG
jgi:hypothetical protein